MKYRYQWDEAKAEQNLAKHGVAFKSVEGFDWDTALTYDDVRSPYGEYRFTSYALIKNRLHALVWTWREQDIRIISLRKANNREREHYDQTIIH